MKKATLIVATFVLLLTGCAGGPIGPTPYAPDGYSGGYTDKSLSPTNWVIRFAGNGFTSQETVQTYWLYHCAEVALSNGYEGFRITTPVKLTENGASVRPGDGEATIIRTHGTSGGSHTYVYGGGYVYGGVQAPKYAIEASILLLKKPFRPVPGQVFDAASLKALLDRSVNGAKCNGNVCPYVHTYLYPPQTATTPG